MAIRFAVRVYRFFMNNIPAFFTLVVVATTLCLCGTLLRLEQHPLSPDYHSDNHILHTMEYQIALNPKPDWTEREEMLQEWIKAMNENNNFINLKREDGVEDIYLQYHLKAGGKSRCNIPGFGIRVRHFDTKTVIDIKGEGGVSDQIQCAKPYWPAEKYYNNSRQKCEEDYHPCFDKFTRGTSVVIDDPEATFETCGSLKEIFPDAFYHMEDDRLYNELTRKPACYWWRIKWKGTAGDHTKYEITFTIKYCKPFEWVRGGKAKIINGEWSLRTYVPNGQQWEKEVVEDLRDLFYHLVIKYDTYEDHKVCARQYFSGEPIKFIDGFEKTYESVSD